MKVNSAWNAWKDIFLNIVNKHAPLERVTMDYKGLQKVTGGYKGLQGVTEGYRGLQGVKRG